MVRGKGGGFESQWGLLTRTPKTEGPTTLFYSLSTVRLLWRNRLALQAHEARWRSMRHDQSHSPSISGSRYTKEDTHQAFRTKVEMNLHPASAGIRGSKPPGFGSRVARVLNYASCTLVRNAEGYLATPSLRDYLKF